MILKEIGIFYEKEKSFEGLNGVFGKPLRFDFYLPSENICIEFNGEQHRRYVEGMMTKKDFETVKEHDRRKNEFCIENNIGLIRMSVINSEAKADVISRSNGSNERFDTLVDELLTIGNRKN